MVTSLHGTWQKKVAILILRIARSHERNVVAQVKQFFRISGVYIVQLAGLVD